MVDIHSHFLYGIDDGAADRETAIRMLQAAKDSGTTDIVATPHCSLKYRFQPDAITAQLKEFSVLPGIPSLHRGCDFHLSFDNIQSCLKDPYQYTINRKCYLLVEFADAFIPTGIDSIFEEIRSLGIVPVITHPERNPMLAKQLPELEKWVRSGNRIQVTGQSFLGRFGKAAERAARAMMDQNLVHFIASDAHDLEHRPPSLAAAYRAVSTGYGEDTANWLFVTNPAASLTGDPVPEAVPRVTEPRRWFKLW